MRRRRSGTEITLDGEELLDTAFVRFGLKNPTHYRLLTQPRDPITQPPRSAEEAREVLEKPLLELWEAGRLRSCDARTASQSVWVLSDGLIHLQTSRPDHDWSKSLVDDSVDALLGGLIAPVPAKRPERSRRRRNQR